MAHDQLRFNLVDGIHGHADHDQKRCSAEIKLHVQTFQQESREVQINPVADQGQMLQVNSGDHDVGDDAEDRQVNSTHDRDLCEDVVHVLGGVPAGPDAGNKSAVFPHVIRRFVGIENNGHVEEAEENDPQDEQHHVEWFTVLYSLQHAAQPGAVVHERQPTQGLWEGQNRGGENHRDHAARIHLERHMCGLTAHHAPADHALGVLHRDAALSALDQHNEGHHRNHHQQDQRQRNGAPFLGDEDVGVDVADGVRQSHHDAGEDDERHAVADTAIADLLAQPHDEGRSGGERNDGQQHESDAGIQHDVAFHRLQPGGNAERLHHGEKDGEIPGPLRDLTPAQFAFFLQLFKSGNNDGQQLENDRRGDVGHDAQREDGELPDVPPRKQVEESEDGALVPGEEFLPAYHVDTRSGNKTAQPVGRQHSESEQDPLAQVGNVENIRQSFQKFHDTASAILRFGRRSNHYSLSTGRADLFGRGFRKQMRFDAQFTRQLA